jgi:hypothetical protein
VVDPEFEYCFMVEVQPSATADGSDKSRLLAEPAARAEEYSPAMERAEQAKPTVARQVMIARLSGREHRPLSRAEIFCCFSPGLRYRLPWAILFRLLRRLIDWFRFTNDGGGAP